MPSDSVRLSTCLTILAPLWCGFTHVGDSFTTLTDLQPDGALAAPVPAWYANGLPVRTDADGSVTFLGSRPLADAGRQILAPDELRRSLAAYFIGASGGATDFRLLDIHQDSSGPDGGRRRLVFVQTFQDIPLLGTYALAMVDGGRLTYARHFVVDPKRLATADVASSDDPFISAAQAQAAAAIDLKDKVQRARTSLAPELAWLAQGTAFSLVWDVPVSTDAPFAQWSIYIDAQHGTVKGRKKLSFDAVAGAISAAIEPSCQGDVPVEVTMPHIDWGGGRVTDAEGHFFHPDTVGEAEVTLSGPFARIEAPVGTAHRWASALTETPGFNAVVADGPPSAQLDAYVYVHQARQWVRDTLGEGADPNTHIVRWTNQQLPVRVDLPSGHRGQSCNAFYDGQSLNFFVENPNLGCNNTGRVAKIVYHEYGHGVHDHLTAARSTLNKQVSEGAADYVAATITNDPHITGLLGCDTVIEGGIGARSNLRTCRNAYNYCRSRRCSSYPRDEEHNAGPVLCGALWDLREAMIARYGDAEGVARADRFVLRFLTLVTDMSSAYAAAIAADEDDDHNPANGTTHSCEINQAFLGVGVDKRAHFPDAVRDRVPCQAR